MISALILIAIIIHRITRIVDQSQDKGGADPLYVTGNIIYILCMVYVGLHLR